MILIKYEDQCNVCKNTYYNETECIEYVRKIALYWNKRFTEMKINNMYIYRCNREVMYSGWNPNLILSTQKFI